MHSGFHNLRSALPMNLKAHHPGFKVWAGAQADIERVMASGASASTPTAGRICSAASPWRTPCTRRCARRFLTYDVKLDAKCAAYTRSIMAWPAMAQWIADARAELEELEELDVEF